MELNTMILADMSEGDLNKLTKAQLIAGIKKDCWLPKHYKSQAEELKKTMDQNATSERAACVMLAAFVGIDLKRNEYSGEVDSKSLNILELAGLAAAKCVSIKEG